MSRDLVGLGLDGWKIAWHTTGGGSTRLCSGKGFGLQRAIARHQNDNLLSWDLQGRGRGGGGGGAVAEAEDDSFEKQETGKSFEKLVRSLSW